MHDDHHHPDHQHLDQAGPPRVRVSTGCGRLDLCAEAVLLGRDWLVWVWGGEEPHIGAVAMAAPRPSLADPERTSATASVFTYPGHKEDGVAKALAERLAAALEARVVVSAGMHWQGLDAQGIAQVERKAAGLADLILAALAGV